MRKKAEFQQPKKQFAKYLSVLMQSDMALYKYYLNLAQRYIEPLSRIIDQGKTEGVFNVQYPRETADILLRAAISFPQSALLGNYIQDEASYQKHSVSLREVIARTLGIDSEELEP